MRALEQILLTNSLADWLGAVDIARGVFTAMPCCSRCFAACTNTTSSSRIRHSHPTSA